MHVYMEPLIDELIQLYNMGVPAHDVSAPEGRRQFTLKVALLWTIHDWPGMSPHVPLYSTSVMRSTLHCTMHFVRTLYTLCS